MAYDPNDYVLLKHLIDLGNRIKKVTDNHDERITAIETETGVKIFYDTKENWDSKADFIPPKGSLIIYSDYAKSNELYVPNFKVGDGKAYLVDLPFSQDDLRNIVSNHINNTAVHLSEKDRAKLENSVTASVTGDRLVFEK